MEVPFIKYVEALVACRYPVDIIYDKITKLNVTLATIFNRDAINLVYKELAKTQPDYFNGRENTPDPNWLREYEIIKMVAYEKKLEIPEGLEGIKGAFEILNDPNMYEVVSALALAKVNDEDIELIANGKFNIHYGPEDIKEFLHYFFNVEEWSLSDKKEYVFKVDNAKLKRTYNYAIDGDKDYLIWKLGIAPDKSFDAMLREMATDAFYNYKEKMKVQPEDSQKWGQLFLRITERVEKLDKDTGNKKSLFEEIKFVIDSKTNSNSSNPESQGSVEIHVQSSIPHISELM